MSLLKPRGLLAIAALILTAADLNVSANVSASSPPPIHRADRPALPFDSILADHLPGARALPDRRLAAVPRPPR